MKKKKLTVYGTVKFGDLSEALGYQLHNVSSCLLFHVLDVSMAGKGEAAKDGAIPADEHFPQAGDRMQRVLTLVRSTLTELKLAIDGTIIMSENLQDALNCMFDARIPARWKKVRLTQLLFCLLTLLL